MKKYILLFCISVLLNSTAVKAQVHLEIVFDSTFSIPGDTFSLGGTLNYNVWLKNSGVTSFNPTFINPLTIYTAVRDTANSFILNIVDTTTAYATDTISAGDSIPISLPTTFTDSSAGYHRDINVIVIWPYAAGVLAIDSLEFPIILIDPNAGVGEIDVNTLLNAFPNPTTDYLSLENKSNLRIEEVRIMDVSGKLVATLKNPTKIETKTWPSGMYLVHVVLENKQSRTIRILKQK